MLQLSVYPSQSHAHILPCTWLKVPVLSSKGRGGKKRDLHVAVLKNPKKSFIALLCTKERPIVSPLTKNNGTFPREIRAAQTTGREPEPTGAGSFWKMWILPPWKGNTDNLQLPVFVGGGRKNTFPLCAQQK